MKTSVLVIFLALSSSAYSQVEQGSYQCSNGGTLNGGFLLYSNGSFEAVAKHKDGVISEVSGIIGRRQARQMSGYPGGQVGASTFTYADMAKLSKSIYDFSTSTQNGSAGYPGNLGGGMGMGMGMGGGFDGVAQGVAPEESDKRPGDNPGLRPGDKVPPKAGDQAPVFRAGDQSVFRERAPLRTGDQVVRPGVITYSAQLDSQGNISQVSYRNGKMRSVYVRIDSNNRTSTDAVYGQLNGQLSNMKTYAKCCANSPGPSCGMNNVRQAQETQRTVKPTSDQNTQTSGSMLMLPFGRDSGSDAK